MINNTEFGKGYFATFCTKIEFLVQKSQCYFYQSRCHAPKAGHDGLKGSNNVGWKRKPHFSLRGGVFYCDQPFCRMVCLVEEIEEKGMDKQGGSEDKANPQY
jgi:hypothetical protein